MAPSCIVNGVFFLFTAIFFPSVQSALVAAKQAYLEEMVGTMKGEDEPEGEVLGSESTGS